jgi:hypothetical protein
MQALMIASFDARSCAVICRIAVLARPLARNRCASGLCRNRPTSSSVGTTSTPALATHSARSEFTATVTV